MMETGRLRRMRLKSKRRSTAKRHKASPRSMADDDNIEEVESPNSLLLSSLRYWEVKRDLIEERIAALRSLTAPS